MKDDITLNSNLLVVDDSLLVLRFIQEMLKDRYPLQLASSPLKALELLSQFVPDLILMDLEMPEMNGFELLSIIKSKPEWRDIPVIFLTGVDDRKKEEKALIMGAVDYITKPISPGVLIKRIQMHLELTAYHRELENLVGQKTKQLLKTQDLLVDILANATTYRDNDTGAHIIRTTEYSRLLVEKLQKLQLPDYSIEDMYANNIIKSAKLHDIGKIAISDRILRKPDRLTPQEFEMIKKHTTVGAQMIDGAISTHEGAAGFLVTAREIILCHHEWWNGRGYPQRLVGKDIPLSARIMAVADVYDALISNRPYKPAFSHKEAVAIMRTEAGTHFDTGLMIIAESLFHKFEEVAHAFQD